MNLICIYVNAYKCLSNQTIVLSKRYKLNSKNLEKISQPHNLYENFDSITALVGKNGSGKSSVLEAIIKTLNSDEESLSTELIIEIEGKLYALGNVSYFRFSKNPIERIDQKELKNFKASLIFYSPIYNPHSESLTSSSLVTDVSNDKLFRYGKGKNREIDIKYQFQFLEGLPEFAEEQLGFDRYLEIDIKTFNFKTLAVKLWNIIQQTIDRDLVRKNFKAFDFSDFFEDGIESFYQYSKNPEENDFLKKELKKLLFDIFERKGTLFSKQINNMNMSAKAETIFMLKELSKHLTFNFRSQPEDYEFLNDLSQLLKSNNIKTWMKSNLIIKNYLGVHKLHLFLDVLKQFKQSHQPIHFTPNQSEKALDFIKEIRKSGFLKNDIIIGWKGISSGQIARLNLFSRLYAAIFSSRSKIFTILLDEADIYLHPEWQRTFLYNLSNFLGEIQKDTLVREYNLIMTTHSPLMISDLVKENVYILSEKTKKINGASNETFGANIYNLYEEEFVIAIPRGEFANLKIKKIHEELQKPILKKNEKVNIQKEINRIGDPLIQMGLNRMISNK